MKHISVFLLLTVAVAACSSEAESLPTTQPTLPTTTTTAPPATSTTILAPVSVTVDGVPNGLATAIANVYETASGIAEATHLTPGLANHLDSLTNSTDISAQYTTTIHEGSPAWVAVAVWEDDIALASSPDGEEWTIVGGRFDSIGGQPYYGDETFQFLVIGSDARTSQDPLTLRADSLHIVTIAPDASTASIVGLPRDSYVETPYGATTKFTNVMSGRGPDVVVETGEMLTGLDLDGYIVTGFGGFVKIVNDFGGMEIDIPFDMAEPKSDAYFTAGKQFIDGFQALAFARNRTLAGGDFTRSFHHGVIMQWGLATAQSKGALQIPAMIRLLEKHAFNDLGSDQLLLILAATFELRPFDIPNIVVDGTPGYAGEASVVFLNDSAFTVFEDLADGVLDTVPDP